MKKLVIFDLDGTLLDTVPDITDNINGMLLHFGYETLSEKQVASLVGSGAKKLVTDCIAVSVKKPLTEEELSERLSYYNGNYTSSSSPKTKPFDGIGKVLTDLKKDGFLIAIMTNKPQETTDRVVKEHLSEFSFDKIVGGSGKVKCKPDKTATVNLLNELGVSPENAFFVGDGETDVLTAINTGTFGISVLWGYRSKIQLEKAGAKVFASTPEELYSIIKNG
ncbi:MAG: HAD family hydrolase [Clostridia bacterium]|nr:HAD family hydrolase [Clostridia bacterium]